MKSEKVQRLRVQMYFGDDQFEVYKDMQEVSKATGMSMSELAYICFVTGFYELREELIKRGVPGTIVGPRVKSKKPRRRPATKTKKS